MQVCKVGCGEKVALSFAIKGCKMPVQGSSIGLKVTYNKNQDKEINPFLGSFLLRRCTEQRYESMKF